MALLPELDRQRLLRFVDQRSVKEGIVACLADQRRQRVWPLPCTAGFTW